MTQALLPGLFLSHSQEWVCYLTVSQPGVAVLPNRQRSNQNLGSGPPQSPPAFSYTVPGIPSDPPGRIVPTPSAGIPEGYLTFQGLGSNRKGFWDPGR